MKRQKPAVWFPAVRCGTGADIFTEQLVEALSDRGVRCEIAWLPHRAEFAPWTVQVPTPPPWATVAHVNSWLPPRFVPKNLPLVVTVHHWVHNADFARHQNRAQRLYHRLHILPTEKANLARASIVTAVSRYTADNVQRHLGHSNVTVIYNGIDTARTFTPGPSRSTPHKPFRLLYVGRWSKRKGCDLLDPIMRLLGPDFELLCVTADPSRARARVHNIRVTGPKGRKALVELYRSSDALLHPARLEGFGLTVCEAMACGLPVVCSGAAALPELVKDGKTGLLCAPDDPRAFSSAILRLASDLHLWTSMRQQAPLHAKSQFSLQAMAESYERLYRSLAGS